MSDELTSADHLNNTWQTSPIAQALASLYWQYKVVFIHFELSVFCISSKHLMDEELIAIGERREQGIEPMGRLVTGQCWTVLRIAERLCKAIAGWLFYCVHLEGCCSDKASDRGYLGNMET